jgi:hypothetical protein
MHAPWWPEVRAEALSFPHHRHDDFCDAIGLCGQILDKMSAPHVPAKKELPPVVSTDPNSCTLTLTRLFEENERHGKRGSARIH